MSRDESRTNGDGKLVVITGPSGAGKSSISREALRRTGAEFSVSATTRRPRAGETDGREYRFVCREEFETMRDRGELLEWAEVFGELYGTPAGPVRRAVAEGRTILLEIDVQGGLQVHETMPEATFILVLPPDGEELARRLRGRGSEDADSLNRRLSKANEEIETARRSGVYEHVVINDDLEQAINEVVRIVEN
mgnify:CR=1 FL=1